MKEELDFFLDNEKSLLSLLGVGFSLCLFSLGLIELFEEIILNFFVLANFDFIFGGIVKTLLANIMCFIIVRQRSLKISFDANFRRLSFEFLLYYLATQVLVFAYFYVRDVYYTEGFLYDIFEYQSKYSSFYLQPFIISIIKVGSFAAFLYWFAQSKKNNQSF